MAFLIDLPRSIIPALDCPPERGAEIVLGTQRVGSVRAFKLGAWKGTLRSGLDAYVQDLGPYLGGRLLIYDHQKGATDIPDLEDALSDLVEAGVHAVIFFPFGGAETLERWTQSAIDAGLSVIVGGHMTQKRFLWSEGGFIHDEAPERIYRLAVGLGVREFVVPGNKPEFVEKYRDIILSELAEQDHHDDEFALYAPGFVAQGGMISEAGKAAGNRWHAIAGRALLTASDVETAALELASQMG